MGADRTTPRSTASATTAADPFNSKSQGTRGMTLRRRARYPTQGGLTAGSCSAGSQRTTLPVNLDKRGRKSTKNKLRNGCLRDGLFLQRELYKWWMVLYRRKTSVYR